MATTLTINNKWNGDRVNNANYVLTISISAATGDIVLSINAPYHFNPAPIAISGHYPDIDKYEHVKLVISSLPKDSFFFGSPFLEVSVGPHSHYSLAVTVINGEYIEKDDSTGLDVDPISTIDMTTGRWTTTVSIPSYWLPEPICGDDLSVLWVMNAFAKFESVSATEWLAYSPVDLQDTEPYLYDRTNMQIVKLYESQEVRQNVDRSISVAKEMFERNVRNSETKNVMKAELEPEELDNSSKLMKELGVKPAPPRNLSVADTAKMLTEEMISKGESLPELEEKYKRHLLENEEVVLYGRVWKRKGWSLKHRVLVLTNHPRLFYTTISGEFKGSIPWSMTKPITAIKVNQFNFQVKVYDHSRIYYLKDSHYGCESKRELRIGEFTMGYDGEPSYPVKYFLLRFLPGVKRC